MDLRRVECFVAVAEMRSFRQAAERLHLSRSPLTRQIMALEHEVGARLLDRDRGRTVTLTEAGRAFLTHVRPALEGAQAAVRHAREAARGKEGRLTIVGCGVLAAPVLAVPLKAFRDELPGVEVSFIAATPAEELSALEEGRAHLVISANFGSPLPPHFQHQELAPVRLVAALPSQHALARPPGTLLSWKALNGETLLCPTPVGVPGYQEFLRGIQQRTGLAPRDLRTVDGVENILHMVAAGYGVAVLPRKLLGHPPFGCRIKRLRLPAPGYRLRMVWRRDARFVGLQRFLEMVGRTAAPAGD